MNLAITSISMEKVYKNKNLLHSLSKMNIDESNESNGGSWFVSSLKEKLLGTAIIVRKKDEDTIIAWGWLVEKKDKEVLKIAIFVEPYYRRMGIGSKIIKRANLILKRRNGKKIVCYPWNETSGKFFRSQTKYVTPCAYTDFFSE